MLKARNRIALGIPTGCSLVLCLAAAGLWTRSTSKMDQLRTADPFRQTTLVSANGELCVERVFIAVPEFAPGVSVAHALPSQYGPRTLNWQFAGLGGGRQIMATLEGPIRYDTLMIPLWLIVILLAVPPVLLWDSRKAGTRSSDTRGAARPHSKTPANL
jgi:hypothetical protein